MVAILVKHDLDNNWQNLAMEAVRTHAETVVK